MRTFLRRLLFSPVAGICYPLFLLTGYLVLGWKPALECANSFFSMTWDGLE